MTKDNEDKKLKTPLSQSVFQRLVMHTLCWVMGHHWQGWGWTGNMMWPTKGIECKHCKLKIRWEDKARVA